MKINNELSFEIIDNQVVVMDNDNKYFGGTKALILNSTASKIFILIKNELSYESIIQEYSKTFNVSYEVSKKDVDDCVNNFYEKGLILND